MVPARLQGTEAEDNVSAPSSVHFCTPYTWWEIVMPGGRSIEVSPTNFRYSSGASWPMMTMQMPKVKVKSNYFIVRPKIDQRAGLLSLPHLGNFRRTATFTTSAYTS